jgi:hypothetical protein
MLEDVDFGNLTTRDDFVSKLPEKQATAKQLRDYFSIPLNFALPKVDAEKKPRPMGRAFRPHDFTAALFLGRWPSLI